MLDIYADESCKDNHHFFVLGCSIVPTADTGIVVRRMTALRQKTNMTRELKWNKISRGKVAEYLQFVDLFFDLVDEGVMQFHALVADAYKFDHRRFNEGSSEIGYNKLMYQLLVKAAVRRHRDLPFYVYLDDRTTRHGLNELQEILNHGFRKEAVLNERPFHRVVFRDSKESDLLQLNDIVLGAIGFIKNEHDKREGCSQAKCAIAQRVRQRAGVRSIGEDTKFARNDFRVWNFRLR